MRGARCCKCTLLVALALVLLFPVLHRSVYRPMVRLPACTSSENSSLTSDSYTVDVLEAKIGRPAWTPDAVTKANETLEALGFVVVRNLLAGEDVAALREYFKEDRNHSKYGSASIIAPNRRHHFKLDPFDERQVARRLEALGLQRPEHVDASECEAPGCSWSASDGFIPQIMPPHSSLVEIASIFVHPQAAAQFLHPDTTYKKGDVRFVSVFIALQNITEEMGPLRLVPRSHRCQTLTEDGESMAMPLPLSAGSAVLMDSRTIHGGGNHTGNLSRGVFYFTWAEPASEGAKHLQTGATYALRKSLWGRTQVPLAAESHEDATSARPPAWTSTDKYLDVRVYDLYATLLRRIALWIPPCRRSSRTKSELLTCADKLIRRWSR